MLRVTADTNIYISALNFGGLPGRFLDLAEAGAIRLAISDAILDEIATVLRREKFAWPEQAIERAQKQLAGFTERVNPTQRIDVIKEDPPDNRILECAQAAHSDYVISGDRHLLRLQQYGNAPILRVADFLRVASRATERER